MPIITKNYGILKLKGFFKRDDLASEFGFHRGLQFSMSHATFKTSLFPFLPSFLGLFNPCNDFYKPF
jgi:hypothetical protein